MNMQKIQEDADRFFKVLVENTKTWEYSNDVLLKEALEIGKRYSK